MERGQAHRMEWSWGLQRACIRVGLGLEDGMELSSDVSMKLGLADGIKLGCVDGMEVGMEDGIKLRYEDRIKLGS
eukprot:15340520-Ditylum_brightwellii.AAC.1